MTWCGVVTVDPPGSTNHVRCHRLATHLVRMIRHDARPDPTGRLSLFESFACDECTADLRRLAVSNNLDVLAVRFDQEQPPAPPSEH